jgi:hypothetical protein
MLELIKITSWHRRGGRCENTRRDGHGWKLYHTRTPQQKKKKNGSAQIRTATFKYILFDKNIPNVQAITPQGP